jgi:hypothetical protein
MTDNRETNAASDLLKIVVVPFFASFSYESGPNKVELRPTDESELVRNEIKFELLKRP